MRRCVPQDTAAREKAESLYFEAVQPLLQQQKFAEAIAILSKATERLKNSAQLELALGVAYYGMRRFDDAADAFLRTIAIAPEIDQPYLFLGRFLDQIPGRLPEVTKQFSQLRSCQSGECRRDTCCMRRRSTRNRSIRKPRGNCSRRRSR